ncbi:hypothetical protein M422DRAFT_51951 [Sphaerobolus stellatus SS14]|uniref:Uncharacterized protein n=1 Tax=Sphaerobolus stellatus (strain SS14) TaxID=990650 RepID=A0A0C9UZ31_SPHS4|nr:hypothetical protein M422DRAFT_51951 [Sphaerobolus stellatus SS14]
MSSALAIYRRLQPAEVTSQTFGSMACFFIPVVICFTKATGDYRCPKLKLTRLSVSMGNEPYFEPIILKGFRTRQSVDDSTGVDDVASRWGTVTWFRNIAMEEKYLIEGYSPCLVPKKDPYYYERVRVRLAANIRFCTTDKSLNAAAKGLPLDTIRVTQTTRPRRGFSVEWKIPRFQQRLQSSTDAACVVTDFMACGPL